MRHILYFLWSMNEEFGYKGLLNCMKRNEEILYKDKIIGIITLFFPHAKIYLFGSYARGTQKRGSDLDIAIDNGELLPLIEHSQVRQMINILNTRQNVDVVDFHSVPLELQKTILEEGVLWKS